jgi:hypothetical protein
MNSSVICSISLYTFTKMPPLETIGDVVSRVLPLVAFCVLFSFFPAIAIIYGWYTGNKTRAVLVGALPFPIIFILGIILIRSNNMVFIAIPGTLLFIVILSVICGLAGYCAAQRTKNYLAVSIILTGIWIFYWMNAFN